jgi:hydroxyethylthiazole kinase-like uncharacterized protein yjeF
MRKMWISDHIRAAEGVLMQRSREGALMRRAAYGASVAAARLLRELTGSVAGRRVVLLVGAGDNGGDALWAGMELRRRGVGVTALLLVPDRAHPAGLAAFGAAGGRVLTEPGAQAASITSADLVLDGIVGISGKGSLRPAAAELVAFAEQARVPILAIDLPSGVDPDTGAVDGPAVRATATVTFGGRKPVHALAPAHCGPVELVDIGLGPYLPEPDLVQLDADDVARRWPVPGPDSDKYNQGVVGVAAGSHTYPGAAVLATGAAVSATSGMVRFAGGATAEVLARWPEVVAAGSVADTGRTQAWTVGPGIGTGAAGRDVLGAVLDRGVPVCLDADAITLVANSPDLADAAREVPVVFTPHAGEFARLAGDVGPDRVGAAVRAARELRNTVLLKGNVTVIADPDGRVLAHPAGNAWAATPGSGDVLSGLIGALLAAGLEPWWAAGCAAYVHSLAAELAASGDAAGGAGAPVGASGLLASVSEAIRVVRRGETMASW